MDNGRLIWMNGKLIPEAEAKISVTEENFISPFTTGLCKNSFNSALSLIAFTIEVMSAFTAGALLFSLALSKMALAYRIAALVPAMILV